MNTEKELEKACRKSVRMMGYDYSQDGMYFITLCVKERKLILSDIVDSEVVLTEVGKAVEQCWQEIPNHYPCATLHEHIIMPNHFHGIISLVGANNYSPDDTKQIIHRANNYSPLQANGTSKTVGAVVGGFKIGIAKLCSQTIWQRNYYEHIIRSADDYHRIADYILTNPYRWDADCYHI